MYVKNERNKKVGNKTSVAGLNRRATIAPVNRKNFFAPSPIVFLFVVHAPYNVQKSPFILDKKEATIESKLDSVSAEQEAGERVLFSGKCRPK